MLITTCDCLSLMTTVAIIFTKEKIKPLCLRRAKVLLTKIYQIKFCIIRNNTPCKGADSGGNAIKSNCAAAKSILKQGSIIRHRLHIRHQSIMIAHAHLNMAGNRLQDHIDKKLLSAIPKQRWRTNSVPSAHILNRRRITHTRKALESRADSHIIRESN